MGHPPPPAQPPAGAATATTAVLLERRHMFFEDVFAASVPRVPPTPSWFGAQLRLSSGEGFEGGKVLRGAFCADGGVGKQCGGTLRLFPGGGVLDQLHPPPGVRPSGLPRGSSACVFRIKNF